MSFPRLGTAPWTLLKEAQKNQVKQKNVILVSIKRFEGGGCMFSSCRTVEEFEVFVAKYGKYYWINEVIPKIDHRNILGAVGIRQQPPRFVLDLDRKCEDGSNEKDWEEEVSDIKDAVNHVLRNITGNEELCADFIDLDNSRPLPRGAYKHSLHLISKTICLESFKTGVWLCDAIEDELTRRGREDSCIDKSIYSANRSLRVLGSKKDARSPALRAVGEVKFSDTLITFYEGELTLLSESQPWAAKNPRKRRASSTSGEGKRMRVDCPVGRMLQRFLDTSPISKAWLWEGARVREVVFTGGTRYMYFKVGFEERGRRHLCAAGEWHNGNCSQTWNIRVNLQLSYTMEAMCWPNQNFSRKCSAVLGKTPWIPIVDTTTGRPVRLEQE